MRHVVTAIFAVPVLLGVGVAALFFAIGYAGCGAVMRTAGMERRQVLFRSS